MVKPNSHFLLAWNHVFCPGDIWPWPPGSTSRFSLSLPWPNLRTICQSLPGKMRAEITVFDLVTLTFDLWPWPPGSTSRLSMSMPCPNLRAICQAIPQIWILVRSHTSIHPDIQKAMHKSPPCIRTGGLKNCCEGIVCKADVRHPPTTFSNGIALIWQRFSFTILMEKILIIEVVKHEED